MTYEYKCNNINCKNYGVKVIRNCLIDERDNQSCDICNKKLERVYHAASIKTFNDGYKG
jgi:hypothetical protein